MLSLSFFIPVSLKIHKAAGVILGVNSAFLASPTFWILPGSLYNKPDQQMPWFEVSWRSLLIISDSLVFVNLCVSKLVLVLAITFACVSKSNGIERAGWEEAIEISVNQTDLRDVQLWILPTASALFLGVVYYT